LGLVPRISLLRKGRRSPSRRRKEVREMEVAKAPSGYRGEGFGGEKAEEIPTAAVRREDL
jgi:hypothetical protein